MTKEMEKLIAERDAIVNEIDSLRNDGSLKAGTAEFKNYLDKLDRANSAIDDQTRLENSNKIAVKDANLVKTGDNGFKTVIDVLKGKITNTSEKLVQGGSNGENYLIPEDVKLEINQAKKEFKSAKFLCTEMPTIGITGSFNFDTAPTDGLISFADGDTIDDQKAPKFTRKTFTITYKGAIIPVSNLLQGNEKAGLMPYLKNWFAKRAIISENNDIFAAAKTNYNSGTPKSLTNWKTLKASINTDLDPAIVENGDFVIVTNQSGFNVLDAALDDNGRPVLQPDPTEPTKRLFMGKRVEVFSNAQLPNSTVSNVGYAPIIYGDTKSALWFIENPSYEFASDGGVGSGFSKNQTLLRVLEGYTVMGANTTDYIYATLPLA